MCFLASRSRTRCHWSRYAGSAWPGASGVSPAQSVPTRAALKPCRASHAASRLVKPVGAVRRHVGLALVDEVEPVHDHDPALRVDQPAALAAQLGRLLAVHRRRRWRRGRRAAGSASTTDAGRERRAGSPGPRRRVSPAHHGGPRRRSGRSAPGQHHGVGHGDRPALACPRRGSARRRPRSASSPAGSTSVTCSGGNRRWLAAGCAARCSGRPGGARPRAACRRAGPRRRWRRTPRRSARWARAGTAPRPGRRRRAAGRRAIRSACTQVVRSARPASPACSLGPVERPPRRCRPR